MTIFYRILLLSGLVLSFHAAPVLAQSQSTCFYLDKNKVKNTFAPLTLLKAGPSPKTDSLHLETKGLLESGQRVCLWSLNGGSGTKEQFSLDGEFAIPVLDSKCEAPFSHQETGVGFGDWYLTLCGTVSEDKLQIQHKGERYELPLKELAQWTSFKPGQFPIEGDHGD